MALNFGFSVDTSSFREGFNDIKKNLDQLVAYSQGAGSKIMSFFKGFDGLKINPKIAVEDIVADAFKAVEKIQSKLEKGLGDIDSEEAMKKFEADVGEAIDKVSYLLETAKMGLDALMQDAQSASDKMGKWLTFQEVGEAIQNMNAMLEESKQKIQEHKASIAESQKALKEAAAAMSAPIPESKVSSSSAENIAQELQEAKERAEELRASIAEMIRERERLEGKGANREFYAERIDQLNKKIEESKKEYTELIGKAAELDTQLKQDVEPAEEMRKSLAECRREMAEMIAEGKQGTPEFQQLAQEAGKMQSEMKNAQDYMRYYSDQNKNLTTLKEGLQGVAGAAGLVTGVMGLFNKNSEEMVAIQTKVQSILSVIVGLETTYNMVKKGSNIQLAIEEVKTWAVAKARGVQTAATNAATAAQEGLNAAMSTNVYGAIISLLAILAVAIYGVVSALLSETEAEKKAREEAEAHAAAIKKQQEDWANAVASSAAKQIISYKNLQRQWNELGDDLKAKEKFVKDNQNAFHDLGAAVNGVSDAENFLVKNTDNVVQALIARAKASAYAKIVEEETEAMVREQIEHDRRTTSASDGVDRGRSFYRANGRYLKNNGMYSFAVSSTGGNETITRDEINYLRQHGGVQSQLANYGNGTASGYAYLTEENKQTLNEYRRQKAQERQKERSDELKERQKEHEENIKLTERYAKEEAGVADKAFKDAGITPFGGSTTKGGGGGGGDKTDYAAILNEEMQKRKRAAEDLAISTAQAEIDAMEEGAEKSRAQIELDYQKRNLEIQRGYENLVKTKIEGEKKIAEAKGQKFDVSSVDLTDEIANRDARLTASDAKRQAALSKSAMMERKTYLDLLKTYGDYEQQKLAITQEYEEKIAKASSPSEAAKLRLQMKDELDKLATDNALQEIDWSGVFNDLEGHTEEYLTSLRDKLQALLASGEIKDLTQLASLQGKIGELNTAIASKGGMFGFTGSYATERARREQAVEDAQRRVATSEGLRMAAAGNVAGLQAKLSGLAVGSPEYARVEGELKAAQLTLAKATEDNTKATQELTEAQDAANESTADKIAGTMSDANEWAQKYLGDAPALLDKLGFGEAGESLSKGLEGFNDAAGAAADFASGNYIGAVVKGISAFENFGDALFGDGGYADTVAAVEENNRIIEANSQAVSRLTEAMQDKGLTTEEARKEYEAIQSMLNQNQELARQNAQRMAGESNWRNHSWNYERNRSYFDYGAFNSVLSERGSGAYVSSAQDVLGLSAKDLDLLRTYAAEGWTKFFDQGGYFGGAEIKAEVEKVADEYKELENAQNSFIASLTNITFDALRDNFKNTLMSMEDDTAAFTDKFEEMFMSSALDAIMATMGIGEELQKWQEEWSKALESGGGLDKDEVDELREQYLDLVERGKEARDLAAEITGYDPEGRSRSGSRGMAQSMSQDTAEELNGRFTAFQISNEGILSNTVTIVGQLSALTAIQTGGNSYLSQIRDIMMTSNGFLEDIAKYSKNMNNTFGTRLESIDNKLTNL